MKSRFKVITNGTEQKVKMFTFSGGEVSVKLDTKPYSANHSTIYALIQDAEGIMTLFNLVDAIRRENFGIKIKLVMPYLPYARQDRVCAPGEALSIKVFADMLNSLNLDEVEVWDVHSDVGIALINNCRNVDQSKVMQLPHFTLVAPDAGAAKKTMKRAQEMQVRMVQAEKIRDPNTGQITHTAVKTDIDLEGRCVVITDDICDGGRTFIELAKVLKEEHKVAKIYLAVTHGIFSKGLDVLYEGGIDEIITTNSMNDYMDTYRLKVYACL